MLYMENVTPDQKQPVIKALAVAGLVGIIIFAAWLAIQIVQVFPSAASSLASLANSVYTYNPEQSSDLELASGQTMVNVGEPFTISWKNPKVVGVYTFSYVCQDGIAIDIIAGEKKFFTSECDKAYELGTDTALSLTIASEKNRFAEIPYTISFFRTNTTVASATYNGQVTVVNSNLFAEAAVATSTSGVIEEETTVTPVEEPEPEVPVVVTPEPIHPVIEPTTPVVVPVVPVALKPQPVYVPEYIYEIPVSQADGQADLLVSYLGLGIVDVNGTFIKTETITKDVAGALQFSVHNIGNKTSEDWTFSGVLPGDVEFASGEQNSLLPNERAVLTLKFKAVIDLGTESYEVSVDTNKDKNGANNTISGAKQVTR